MISKHKSDMKASGTVKVAKISEDEIQIRKTKNVTVEVGHKEILDSLREETQDITISQIAVGTGGQNGTSVGDTNLNNRVAVGEIFNSTSVNQKATFSGLIGANSNPTNDIDEIGLLSNRGELINHATIAPVSKDSNSIILITVDLQITDK
jgi:hypothetical protein